MGMLKQFGQRAADRLVDKVSTAATKPASLAKAEQLIKAIDTSPVGSQLANRLDQGLGLAVQAGERHAEHQGLELATKKKRLRWIGAVESIGGSVALITLFAVIAVCWQHEEWRAVLSGKTVIVLAVGLIVSIGLIITGIRTLFTARG